MAKKKAKLPPLPGDAGKGGAHMRLPPGSSAEERDRARDAGARAAREYYEHRGKTVPNELPPIWEKVGRMLAENGFDPRLFVAAQYADRSEEIWPNQLLGEAALRRFERWVTHRDEWVRAAITADENTMLARVQALAIRFPTESREALVVSVLQSKGVYLTPVWRVYQAYIHDAHDVQTDRLWYDAARCYSLAPDTWENYLTSVGAPSEFIAFMRELSNGHS